MGCIESLCSSANNNNGFESLEIAKSNPISIVDVQLDDSNSDIPLFAPASSDDDDIEISDVEILSSSSSEDDK